MIVRTIVEENVIQSRLDELHQMPVETSIEFDD